MTLEYTPFEIRCIAFNNSQSAIGGRLKTLKGSIIQRSKHGVGKLMARKLYFHKSYANKLLIDMDAFCLFTLADSKVTFNYNIVKWDPINVAISLEEVADFDNAREPVVGRVFTVNRDGCKDLSKPYVHILHHKWTMVDNSYSGFDVAESWEWSRTWLNLLHETANGNSYQYWEEQLKSINLA